MTAKPVTPAEAKEVWDSFKEPSARKVAAKFEAAGRKISFKSIAKWKREGWGAKSAAQLEERASRSIEEINTALPAITGDVNSKLEDVAPVPPEAAATSPVPAQTVTTPVPDTRDNAERAEDALLACINGATTVWNAIIELATMKPTGGAAADKDVPPIMLMAEPEGIAKLMKAASEATSRAIEDFKQIPLLRAEAAASVAGTQTVYPPGQGPHADEDFPLRSAMQAFDAALKDIRERKS